MDSAPKLISTGAALLTCLFAGATSSHSGTPAIAQSPPPAGDRRIDLGQSLAAGSLRSANRKVTKLSGSRDGVHVSANDGPGVVWIDGSQFADGTIELDVRGRDVFQQSFVGVAFHGQGDDTYEAVYLRPFNFRADDPVRHRHAVQYMAAPDFDWPRLRRDFPEEFERPVGPSIAPTDWVPLRVLVHGPSVRVTVGTVATPTLDARKLGNRERGLVGLWTGNNSDGDFANLRLTR
jgi:hypothetical protein